MKGTNNLPFFNSLSKNRPSDSLTLMDRVEKYIRQDDAFLTIRAPSKHKVEIAGSSSFEETEESINTLSIISAREISISTMQPPRTR